MCVFLSFSQYFRHKSGVKSEKHMFFFSDTHMFFKSDTHLYFFAALAPSAFADVSNFENADGLHFFADMSTSADNLHVSS